MYQFDRTIVGPFALHTSLPSVGDEHHKRYGTGVTPQNQATLNLYISGQFELEMPAANYRRIMSPGDCSLDIELSSFPEGLCIERCLAEGSRRICISTTSPRLRWARQVMSLSAGSAFVGPESHLLVITTGIVDCDGVAIAAGESVMLGAGQVLRSDAEARGVLMAII